MADDETTSTSATAVLDRPGVTTQDVPEKAAGEEKRVNKNKKKQRDIDEYEVEFETPFGKIEFEFEPKSTKERKDREKREKQQRDAAKAEAKAQKRAEKMAAKHARQGIAMQAMPAPKRGGSLLPVLLIFAIVVGAVALAIWLFARPGERDPDAVPAEFLNDAPTEPEPQPQGFAAKAQARVRDAIRAGRQASRETQEQQQKKFEDLTR